MVLEPCFERLTRQVAGGGDTKSDGIIPQWQESGGGDMKSAGIIPHGQRGTICAMGYPFRPDEDVRNKWGSL